MKARKASDFLALCEIDICEANRVTWEALGHAIQGINEDCWATVDKDGKHYNFPQYIDDLLGPNRADADLACEVEDALFKLADEKKACVKLFRNYPAMFQLTLFTTGSKGNTSLFCEHSNLSWLMAAALVELRGAEK